MKELGPIGTVGEEKVSFVIEGGFLTALTRSLWADEDEPAKAVHILTTAFPDMPKGEILAVLQGEKRLEGDSRNGITLERDGEVTSRAGNLLSAGSVFEKMQNKLKLIEERAFDMQELLIGNTESCSSPEGLVVYPQWRKKSLLKGEVELKDMVYKGLGSAGFFEGSLCRDAENEEDDKLEPPPEPECSISTNSGWLSQEGKFYPCGYMEHISMARRLGFKEVRLEKLGWVKMLSIGEFIAPDRDVTQAQIDMIWDWCQAQDKPMPWWVEDEK